MGPSMSVADHDLLSKSPPWQQCLFAHLATATRKWKNNSESTSAPKNRTSRRQDSGWAQLFGLASLALTGGMHTHSSVARARVVLATKAARSYFIVGSGPKI